MSTTAIILVVTMVTVVSMVSKVIIIKITIRITYA